MEGGVNQEWLLNFLKELEQGLKQHENFYKNDKQKKKVIIILDNATAHKTKLIKSWAVETGADFSFWSAKENQKDTEEKL